MTAKLHLVGIALAIAAVTGTAGAANLVVNGSFEVAPEGTTGSWAIFDSIDGWQLARGPSIELQRNVNGWHALDGEQYLELDSDIDGPDGEFTGDDASSAVFQDLETVPATLYVLSFAFSPRPGVEDNALEVWWDGKLIDTVTGSGLGLTEPEWEVISYQVLSTADTTRIEFGDVSVSDSFGTFLDQVSVTPIPEPHSLVLLLGGALLGLRRRLG